MSTDDLFGGATVADVTLDDQLRSVEREIAYRERVYPRWVEDGRMKAEDAARELLVMRAVRETVAALMGAGQDGAGLAARVQLAGGVAVGHNPEFGVMLRLGTADNAAILRFGVDEARGLADALRHHAARIEQRSGRLEA